MPTETFSAYFGTEKFINEVAPFLKLWSNLYCLNIGRPQWNSFIEEKQEMIPSSKMEEDTALSENKIAPSGPTWRT